MRDIFCLVQHIDFTNHFLLTFFTSSVSWDWLMLWCFAPTDWKSVHGAQCDRGLLRNPRRYGLHHILCSGGSELLRHGQAFGGYPAVCAHGAGGANPSSPLEAYSCYFTHAEDRSDTQPGSESWHPLWAWFTPSNKDFQPGTRGWANLIMSYYRTRRIMSELGMCWLIFMSLVSLLWYIKLLLLS